jgi:hypothetical protein
MGPHIHSVRNATNAAPKTLGVFKEEMSATRAGGVSLRRR